MKNLLLKSLLLLFAVFVLVGCASHSESDAGSINYSTLGDAAYTTYRNFYDAVERGEAEEPTVQYEPEVSHEPEIPEQYWAEEIKALSPVRVYRHSSHNIVVVLKEEPTKESGLYIYHLLSSSFAGEGGKFNFNEVYKDIYEYSLVPSN